MIDDLPDYVDRLSLAESAVIRLVFARPDQLGAARAWARAITPWIDWDEAEAVMTTLGGTA